jgi:hypothetical protein
MSAATIQRDPRAAMLEHARITDENARMLERANLTRGARLLRERATRNRRLAESLVAGLPELERGMVREEA